jgi:hypothetical protein
MILVAYVCEREQQRRRRGGEGALGWRQRAQNRRKPEYNEQSSSPKCKRGVASNSSARDLYVGANS